MQTLQVMLEGGGQMQRVLIGCLRVRWVRRIAIGEHRVDLGLAVDVQRGLRRAQRHRTVVRRLSAVVLALSIFRRVLAAVVVIRRAAGRAVRRAVRGADRRTVWRADRRAVRRADCWAVHRTVMMNWSICVRLRGLIWKRGQGVRRVARGRVAELAEAVQSVAVVIIEVAGVVAHAVAAAAEIAASVAEQTGVAHARIAHVVDRAIALAEARTGDCRHSWAGPPCARMVGDRESVRLVFSFRVCLRIRIRVRITPIALLITRITRIIIRIIIRIPSESKSQLDTYTSAPSLYRAASDRTRADRRYEVWSVLCTAMFCVGHLCYRRWSSRCPYPEVCLALEPGTDWNAAVTSQRSFGTQRMDQ